MTVVSHGRSPLIRAIERALKNEKSSLNAAAPRLPIDAEMHAAILGTNEVNARGLYQGTRDANRQARTPANGYLVGAGVANALSAVAVFEPGTRPKGIVLIDVDPRVVVAGRVLIALFRRHTTFDALVAQLGDLVTIAALIRQVIAAETNPRVRAQFETVSVAQLTQTMAERRETLEQPRAFRSSNVSMVHALRERYRAFRACARDGTFVILLGDLTNAKLTSAIAALPGYAAAHNVVYLSNVIDVAWVHAGRRSLRKYTNAVARLAPSGRGRNTYLATSFNDEYHVKAYPTPPVLVVLREQDGRHRRGDLVCQANAEPEKLLGPFRAFPVLEVTVGTEPRSVIKFPRTAGVTDRHLRIIYNDKRKRWVAVAECAPVRVRRSSGTVMSRRSIAVNTGDALLMADGAALDVHIVNTRTFANALVVRVQDRGCDGAVGRDGSPVALDLDG